MDDGLWTRWLRPLVVGAGIVAVCLVAAILLGRDPGATPTPSSSPTVPLLRLVTQKDGDSFVASDGKEYRLGMVNTPELDERCGREAREFSRRFLASGLTVYAYSSDRYGRRVAEVLDRTGRSLNVALARSGYADDRYLDPFWHENPDLARRLEKAFAQATEVTCAKD